MSPKEINKALAHLNKDLALARVIEKSQKPKYISGGDPFQALVRAIIFQQLSGKAASTILARFQNLFVDKKSAPKKILQLKDEKFKSVGISGQKMNYLRDLSVKFLDGTINPALFPKMSDSEIREHLIAVKGIGTWTADMFLMFTLHRPDILPTGDLAIQKGFQRVFGLKKMPDVKKMEKLAKNWQPYRTIASHYLWRSIDDKEGNW